MPNAIGTEEIEPISFDYELRQAGLGRKPFTFANDGTITFDESMAQADQDAVLAVYAAHNPHKGELSAYANAVQWQLQTGGFTTTIGGTKRRWDTESVSYSLIHAKMTELKDNEMVSTINWQFGPYDIVPIVSPDFIVSAQKIADFVQATYDKLQWVVSQIGIGAITTREQIDAAFAAIPTEG